MTMMSLALDIKNVWYSPSTMAFIDELDISAKGGDGGDGVVRFLHEKNREFGGPSGGNGGNGGNVYVLAVRDVHLLSKYRTKKEFNAERGKNGGKDTLHGNNGEDLEIQLPIGSIITNLDTNKKIALQEEGNKELLLEGGVGGRGNESFKSSTNRTPKEFTEGSKGEEGRFFIEIELVADIGLIGLPSAGKTSLLNVLTAAKGKVGAYPFTTLEPNLGEMFGYIVSDIPGLIEGASDGKGLGHKFLRHVKRTRILVHLVSLENEDPLSEYKIIRNELEKYDPELPKKKEIVLLTKTDLVNKEKIDNVIKDFKDISETVRTISIYDDKTINELRDFLIKEVSS